MQKDDRFLQPSKDFFIVSINAIFKILGYYLSEDCIKISNFQWELYLSGDTIRDGTVLGPTWPGHCVYG